MTINFILRRVYSDCAHKPKTLIHTRTPAADSLENKVVRSINSHPEKRFKSVMQNNIRKNVKLGHRDCVYVVL